jgi:ABC-type uncharacterized transport system permease subunit
MMLEAGIGSALRLSTPLIYAALAGYASERPGVINIALEGKCLLGAFFAAVGAHVFQNPFMGVLCGIAASVSASLLHGLLCVQLRANPMISGLAINFLGLRIPPFVAKKLFGYSGGTPQIPSEYCIPHFSYGSPLTWGALVFGLLFFFIHNHTKLGQYFQFAGDHPNALESQGISPAMIRWIGLLFTGLLCGLAGSYLSIDHGTAFSRNMTAGRGFIALAALILGNWNPPYVVLSAFFLGSLEVVQILLQGTQLTENQTIPVQWITLVPYAATLLILYFRKQKYRLN